MSVLNIILGTAGADNIVPRVCYINTDNTLAEVTATGYLNASVQAGYAFQDSDMCLVTTKTSPSATSVEVGWFEISKSGANTSLSPSASPGSVALPTVANQMAYATDTVGSLAAAGLSRIMNAGGIDAGLSGTAGTFRTYPATAANGYLEVFATANGGARNVTLTNAAHGQTSAYVIPDCGNANGRILVGASATPFTTGRLLASSGTGGLVADSGVATTLLVKGASAGATTLQGVTDTYAGGGTSNAFTVTGITTAYKAVATIQTSTNAVAVAKAVATNTNELTITFTGDPGAATTVNYWAWTP